MEPTNCFLAIVEDNPVILKASLAYRSPLLNFEPILAVGSEENEGSHKQAAEKLSIRVDPLKFHIRNVYGKLKLNSRTEMMERYKKSGVTVK